MTIFQEIFSQKHALLIVVHVENESQGLRNVEIACAGGADGVFLINHNVSFQELLKIYKKAKESYPAFWIGVNFLDIDNEKAISLAGENNISGLWMDDAGIIEDAADPCENVKRLRKWQWKYGADRTLLFGGVAFKYQTKIRNYALVAALAKNHIDVVTTSGEGTGIAPDVLKIKSMKQVIGKHPIAIASGITLKNVSEYLPHADCFLVATGVSDSHTELNLGLIRELSKAIH